MDTDRDLLFGILALQAGLIDSDQFVEACTLWATRKNEPLADLLTERGWILPADRAHLDYLLERKVEKHGGDARASIAAAGDDVKRSLAALNDADIQNSLAGLPWPEGCTLLPTVDHVPPPPERYTLTRLHATGGIGRVWLAHDSDLGRDVALKELRPERAASAPLGARFLKEARITGQLEHPGVVPVYELTRRRGDRHPFYTMRFVKGRTLTQAARLYHQQRADGRDEPLDLLALLNSFVAVCNTVAYAHSRGVIHRDLKGQNVIVGDFGEVIVLDWGLAKLVGRGEAEMAAAPVVPDPEGADCAELTAQGQALGTPAYMAPEQAVGRPDLIDCRTDVYGLGAILYEILSGRPPFTGSDTQEVLRKVREEEPVRPSQLCPGVPPALERACLRALGKRPEDRYASAGDLARDVQHWQEVQRRQAEEALLRQTEILQSILNSMSEAVVVADARGNLLLSNPAAGRILGFRPTDTTVEEVRQRLTFHLPGTDGPCPPRELPLARALRGEVLDQIEVLIHHDPAGEGTWLSVNGRPLKDDKGVTRGGVLVCRDITTRKRAEEALRESHNLLRAIAEGTRDAVFVKDLRGRYLMINSAGAAFFGKAVAEVVGRDDTALFAPEAARQIMEDDRHTVAAAETRTYERTTTVQGITRTYLAAKGPYRDAQGRIIGVLGISRDITDRKRAAEALQASEERLLGIVETVPYGLCILDRDGRITLANAAAEAVLGRPRGEITGRAGSSAPWEAAGVGGPAPLGEALAARVLRTGLPAPAAERAIDRPDGSRVILSIHAAPLRDPDGSVYGVLVSFSGRTDRTGEAAALQHTTAGPA
jgi:PAS domain S-box-containing protein